MEVTLVSSSSSGSWIRPREEDSTMVVAESSMKRARTPPRGGDDSEVDPRQRPAEEMFDRRQCNFHTVELNEQAVGVAVRCNQVPTEFLPTDGEVADGVTIRGVYFCTRHACQILKAKDEGRDLRVRVNAWEAERIRFRGHASDELKHQVEAERALVTQFKQAAEAAFAEVGARCSGLEGLTTEQAEAIRSATAQTEVLGTRYQALRHEAEEELARRATEMKRYEQRLIAEAAAQRENSGTFDLF